MTTRTSLAGKKRARQNVPSGDPTFQWSHQCGGAPPTSTVKGTIEIPFPSLICGTFRPDRQFWKRRRALQSSCWRFPDADVEPRLPGTRMKANPPWATKTFAGPIRDYYHL